MGSIVKELSKRLPALTALFVILASAVAPIMPKAENLDDTVSTLFPNPLEPSVALLNEELIFSIVPPIFNLLNRLLIPCPAVFSPFPNLSHILVFCVAFSNSSKFNVFSCDFISPIDLLRFFTASALPVFFSTSFNFSNDFIV